ncbi:MAG: insulinase family protein [Planctomycetaceae bacterium]|nr:insulinase family protein [Planctomycetaceae bacterium]
MPSSTIETCTLSNGMTVLFEPMPDVESVAWTLMIPAGAVFERPDQSGTAAASADWLLRGAGPYGNRELSAAFDDWGSQRHETATPTHIVMQGAALGGHLDKILPLYGYTLREPLLHDDEFEAVMIGVEQNLLGLEDDPRQKLMTELVRASYTDPWGRPADGTLDNLMNIDSDDVRAFLGNGLNPSGAILGLAGNLEIAAARDLVESVFGSWTPAVPAVVWPKPSGSRSSVASVELETAQTQIGVSFPSVAYSDADYYAAWAIVDILSGGMSSRLFHEIRERRGLCYSVSASLHTAPGAGRVLCYAGTTAERAQETLDVLLAELRNVAAEIRPDELARTKARAKSALIMAQESTGSRAGSLARDWFHLGRVTTLEEVRQKVENLTVRDLAQYLERHPVDQFTILTMGPAPLLADV